MRKMMKRFKNEKGLTLVELLAVIVILAIVGAIAFVMIGNVMENAKILLKEPENYDARAEIMWCSTLSHNDLTGCGTNGGDWATHLIEHELGGLFDVAHGAGLAAVWGSWARYVMDEKPERFAKFAENVMGIEDQGDVKKTALAGIEAVEAFYREIHMPTNLRELGVEPTEEQIRDMAMKATNNDTVELGVFKKLKAEDLIRIYTAAK